MQKIYDEKIKKIENFLFLLMMILVAVVLMVSLCSQNKTFLSRIKGETVVVKDVTTIDREKKKEYTFWLKQVEHSETLAFYVAHNEVEVYVGDECVYFLRSAKDDVFTTVGDTWVMIPLYEEDAGKEVRVLLTPLYENYQTEMPEFMLGSENAISDVILYRAMPALLLSVCVMFTGILLICLAIYHSVKGVFGSRMYALGLMALGAGLWRLTYDRVIYLLMGDHAVMIYTISIISIMIVALSMLNFVETDEKGKEMIRGCSCVYCGMYIVQLLLQIIGFADLRQTLKGVHITLIVSAVIFMWNSIRQWHRQREKRKANLGWILGAGVLIDLWMYYFSVTSIYMVFTMVGILCYSILEGMQLLFDYIEQKNALEEMEIQLTLSRTNTMMSQIRSHFVFNVLNAISGLCKYNPEKADETVIRFARYLRNNIDIMEKDGNIPFRTDLQQLEDYVALEQVRFGDKIELYTDIEYDDFVIPQLILQPVVENAIKHGLSKKQGEGSIILRTRDEGNRIVIIVEDDGVGFDMEELKKETSVGIRNIRFRLEHLVGGKMNMLSEIGKGTTVTITIPKERNK